MGTVGTREGKSRETWEHPSRRSFLPFPYDMRPVEPFLLRLELVRPLWSSVLLVAVLARSLLGLLISCGSASGSEKIGPFVLFCEVRLQIV